MGKRIILTVGAADFSTDAWCNGQHLGHHEGGYTPFEFDLTEALRREGDRVLVGMIVFRVEDPMNNSDQPVGKQWGWYSSASGIWQTVFVEPRAAAFIERFEVTTDIARSSVRFQIFTRGGAEVSLVVIAPTGAQLTPRAPVVEGVADCTVSLKDAALWDTNSPQLYKLTFTPNCCITSSRNETVSSATTARRRISAMTRQWYPGRGARDWGAGESKAGRRELKSAWNSSPRNFP